ncbi:hypothetical protein L873DRAFT_1786803 [Choiromyces venosus 120613-1]|uniref:Uncharacterized protein n=1 Tax=Choiromyces venosus 120613-1 TaxID=1336337 RepID=A0A3N4JZM3_9PEZI|nr:hypothetical protein L873DRAFT_1786803 [Choiromyces venosus 120613-1]
MARARSPPLAFLAQAPLPAFPAFTLQQPPPPRSHPHHFSSSSSSPTENSTEGSDAYETIHNQYQKLLAHEREGMELERTLWLSERQFYLDKIAKFESTIKSLREELEKAKTSITTTTTSDGEPKDKDGDKDSEKDNVSVITSPPPPVTGPVPGAEPSPPADVPMNPVEAESPEVEEEARTPKQENDVEQFARPFSELDEKTTKLLYEQARRIVYPQRTWPEEKLVLDDDEEGDDEDIKLILKKNTNFGWAF